jgi:predicted nucleotidyltransferase
VKSEYRGVAAPVLSAHRRHKTVARCACCDLTAVGAPSRKRNGSMIAEITMHRGQLASLCERYGVLRLDIFGSAARGSFDPTASDLDFVAFFADRTSPDYVDRYLDFADALEVLFGRPVDLLTERSIRSPFFRRAVDRDRETIYERPGSATTA